MHKQLYAPGTTQRNSNVVYHADRSRFSRTYECAHCFPAARKDAGRCALLHMARMPTQKKCRGVIYVTSVGIGCNVHVLAVQCREGKPDCIVSTACTRCFVSFPERQSPVEHNARNLVKIRPHQRHPKAWWAQQRRAVLSTVLTCAHKIPKCARVPVWTNAGNAA